jgi:hypothetical protein
MRHEVSVTLPDLLAVGGCVLLLLGLLLWSIPLALVVSGAGLAAAGVWMHFRGGSGDGAGEQAGQPSEATSDSPTTPNP